MPKTTQKEKRATLSFKIWATHFRRAIREDIENGIFDKEEEGPTRYRTPAYAKLMSKTYIKALKARDCYGDENRALYGSVLLSTPKEICSKAEETAGGNTDLAKRWKAQLLHAHKVSNILDSKLKKRSAGVYQYHCKGTTFIDGCGIPCKASECRESKREGFHCCPDCWDEMNVH